MNCHAGVDREDCQLSFMSTTGHGLSCLIYLLQCLCTYKQIMLGEGAGKGAEEGVVVVVCNGIGNDRERYARLGFSS